MLIDIETRRAIEKVPYPDKFKLLRERLTADEFNVIEQRINELIDQSGGEIATAGWLPGSNWEGTPFQPIYSKAARQNFQLAAQLFGLFVWYTVMNRPETWASGRYKKDDKDIGSRTYFTVDK
jgi:hypothetical protein